MVAGGKTVKGRRWVISLSTGGAVIGSVVLCAETCCTPMPPPATPSPPPPAPTMTSVVDAAPPEASAPDGASAEQCVFQVPRERALKRRAPRIVGGTEAPAEKYPFVVALATPERFQYCGGSVANATHVRTAAHCMVSPGDVVLVGSNDLRKARAVRVSESRIHPAYDPVSMANDASVLQLAEPIDVPPLPLAEGITTNVATVVGWGRLSENGSTTPLLQYVNIDVLNDSVCAEAYGTLDSTQLCAGKLEGGKDSCQGDSGGPLLTWNVDHFEQLGFVSFGAGCARPGAPGVYADARDAELRHWLRVCSR